MNLLDQVKVDFRMASDDVILEDGRILGQSIRSLEKVSSVIRDEDTVDSILSLGYISNKNIGLFMSHLPELRAAESAIAEMLVAARLGQSGLSSEALQSTLYALNESIEDLESLVANESVMVDNAKAKRA